MAASGAAPARSLSLTKIESASFTHSVPWWYLFFFISGFPALLYQIVWQRALFTLYGVNIESVTMVVTAFLVGLGLGSLAGGILSKNQHLPLLTIFGAVELLIGSYGVVSLKIFHWAAGFTAGAPPLRTGLVAFTLVAIPTLLMGSTLPILVSYTVRMTKNVGASVGALYAANTLGSAAACFCAAFFLMGHLGQSRTVLLAAALNAILGTTILLWQSAARAQRISPKDSVQAQTSEFRLGFAASVISAAVAGFISLGYEIVWYHLFSFTTAGLAKSFSFLLGAYLAGIGIGSIFANWFCGSVRNSKTFVQGLVACVFAANLVGFLVAPILFQLVVNVSYLWTLIPIGIAAGCLGAVFPLLCHISVQPDSRAGAKMSFVYLSNILGSALGSYITGFVLMDVLPVQQVCVLLALLGIILGVALVLQAKLQRRWLAWAGIGALAAALFVVFSAPDLFHGMYEKMLMKQKYVPGAQFASVVENRSGVIAVTQLGTVFGGGIYDGKFNISLVHDTNGIQRAFALSYFCPDPKEVLMIGLSSGSWAQVIANHPALEHLTIVEINPGYLSLIQRRAEVASLLHNPKVRIEIDDGRRWLIRNPQSKFDTIVMNTSYHWRSNASNLLSTGFLRIIQAHLKPGGVHFYNTTDSDEALATGLKVFPYGMRVGNFLAVSDSPLQLDTRRWSHILTQYTIDGEPVFDLQQEQHRRRFVEVLQMVNTMDRQVSDFFSLESAPHIRARTQHARIITDDNMGTEWLQ